MNKEFLLYLMRGIIEAENKLLNNRNREIATPKNKIEEKNQEISEAELTATLIAKKETYLIVLDKYISSFLK